MQRELKIVHGSETPKPYRVRVANLEEADQRTFWDRCLGVVTMAVVSAGGWTAIIELIRVLR
jgi:hypothetical protein